MPIIKAEENLFVFGIQQTIIIASSRGLVVELGTDNSLPSATVGSSLRQVWCINRSVEETLCYNSNCRTPGPFGGLSVTLLCSHKMLHLH